MSLRILLAVVLMFGGIACQTVQPAPYIEREAQADEAAAEKGRTLAEDLYADARAAEARGDYEEAHKRRSQGSVAENLADRAEQGADTKRELSRNYNEAEEEREELLGAAGFQKAVEFIGGAVKTVGRTGAIVMLCIVLLVAAGIWFWKTKGGAIGGTLGGMLGKAGSVAGVVRGWLGGGGNGGN